MYAIFFSISASLYGKCHVDSQAISHDHCSSGACLTEISLVGISSGSMQQKLLFSLEAITKCACECDV